jgi:hypothetical protein
MCTLHSCSHWLRPRNPTTPPRIWAHKTRGAIGQHLLVIPCKGMSKFYLFMNRHVFLVFDSVPFVCFHSSREPQPINSSMYNPITKAPFWRMLIVRKTLSSCGLRRLSGVAGWLTGMTACACYAADILRF